MEPGTQRYLEQENARQRALSEEKAREQRRQDEMREQRAKERRDKKFQLFNTFLGAVAGSIVTLVVEHFTSFLSWFHR